MPVIISMLRGVNVTGHNKIKMDALRELYASLRFRDALTFIQSGNVVFRTDERDLARLAERIGSAIERRFGFRPKVILRTTGQLRRVLARNPFAKRRDLNPSKLLINFFANVPGREARDTFMGMKAHPEELRLMGSELYVYFPNGMGRSKLWHALDKALNKTATGRNLNSVMKMLEIAERMEESHAAS